MPVVVGALWLAIFLYIAFHWRRNRKQIVTSNCKIENSERFLRLEEKGSTMSTSDNDSDVSEDGISLKIDSKGPKDFNIATPAEFVKRFAGKRVIEKVLIANNGIAAVKCMRSIRRWAYELFGNERAIRFVAMVTPEDLKANAEYIKIADQYVPVSGGTNNHNYANVELILDIAKRIPVQAVWAGWGHASENPKLPDLLSKHGITFIGPPASAMWALGDKIASTIVAQTVGVPTLPWSGSGLKLDPTSNDYVEGKVVAVSHDLYLKGCIQDVSEGIKIARDIGYPVMIKASEGGGGKGIRKASNDDEFTNFLRQVQAEVPGSPVFVMKLAKNARHLEVQLLADEYGNAISIFGRDCSVQRRHQKIIEEAPAAIADPDVFKKMEEDAVKLGQLVGYISAGTVEYLYHPESHTFHFLELNPRLQVEHPCTEMVSDINLPAAQLQIAMGIPLYNIKDIRTMYGVDPFGKEPIDFDNPQNSPKPKGHVIATRITSENPDEGFKPSSGTIKELTFRSMKNVWGYFSVGADGGLHEFADSQFGHCFAWGEDRDAARRHMVLALKEISIRGDFRTTVEYLIKLLEHEYFSSNKIDTGWLDFLISKQDQSERPDAILGVICGAVHIADAGISKRYVNFKSALERGQILSTDSLTNQEDVELINEGIKYILRVSKSGPNTFFVELNDSWTEVDAHRMSDGGLLLSWNESSHTTYMKEEVDSYRLTISGKTCIFQKENDPTVLRSPSAGRLIHFVVDDGGHVFQGEAFAEIEVMKMVMPLLVSESGCVHYVKNPGAVLEPGSIVAKLELDDPSKVTQAQLYSDQFPEASGAKVKGTRLHQVFRVARENLQNIMDGYSIGEPHFSRRLEENVSLLMQALKDPALPLLELQEMISSISGRIPPSVEESIKKHLSNYASNITSVLSQFPSQQIANVVDAHAATLTKRVERDAFFLNTQNIVQLVQRYRNGIRGHMKAVVLSLLRQYLQHEVHFNEGNFEKCVTLLRDKHKSKDLSPVVHSIFSHASVARKNQLTIMLIDQLCGRQSGMSDELNHILQELTALNRHENAKVALRARQALLASQQPSYELRHNQVESLFLSGIAAYGNQLASDSFQKLILSDNALFDILPSFFYHANEAVRTAALEVYIRRSYQAYELTTLYHEKLDESVLIVEFQFILPNAHPNRLPLKVPSSKTVLAMPRVRSLSEDMFDLINHQPALKPCQRTGVMAAFQSMVEFERNFEQIMNRFEPATAEQLSPSLMARKVGLDPVWEIESRAEHGAKKEEEPIHIINIALKIEKNSKDIEFQRKMVYEFTQSKKEILKDKGIRRITYLISDCKGMLPWFFTFRAGEDFQEDSIYRHLEPALAYQLEINRLRNFDLETIPTTNHNVHLYLGSAKKMSSQSEVTDYRFFIRSIVRHSDFITKEASFEYMEKESEIQLLEALDQLEVSFSESVKRTDCNHIFLHFVPCVIIEPNRIEESIRHIVTRYGRRLWKLRVLQAEMKVTIRLTPTGKKIPLRVFMSNGSGYYLDFNIYREVTDPRTGQIVFESYGQKQGPHHGLLISTPYVTKDHLQLKRFSAQSLGTTYVYDFPELFKQAISNEWMEWANGNEKGANPNKDVLKVTEYVLDESDQLMPMNRLHGENTIGMIAWRMECITPTCPEGREIIVVANDITVMIGSFAPPEDMLFKRASEMARAQGLPFVYISANSGARIGLAEEVKHHFNVAWNDAHAPEKGFKYLYVTPSDFKKLSASNSMHAELIEDDGESRYQITDIIGRDDGIGVENLKGSGMIAGEMSAAYDDIVTMSLVTCRAVGIGSYLVRLGQRVIQVDNAHVILTGARALNKVLGRQVYTSDLQLGGPQIMHNNGVTHLVVRDDFGGIAAIMKWLSYVPKFRNGPLPIIKPKDPVDREVEFVPPKAPHDPRHFICGAPHPDKPDLWLSGFFDKDSFVETLDGWAKTVVCGRARLGGVPMGVIAVETRAVEVVIPADPGNPESDTKIITQAGQVWYPDSAYKTAQAIRDFNKEQLPLIIFANWRGFSGGMKDMYESVLKYGAYIVDALREYKQPVFIYLPPNGELRGGAWVVVDPTINPEAMEMYADQESRGGVLEPAGTVEIKFRRKDLVKAIHRLDTKCQEIIKALTSADLPVKERKTLERQQKEREEQLINVYQQVSVEFAGLHDTPGRMQEKGVITDILKWKESRRFFYWRLRRILMTRDAKKKIRKANPDISGGQLCSMLERLFLEGHGNTKSYLWNDNKAVVEWLEKELSEADSVIGENVKCIRRDWVLRQVKTLVQENPEVAMDSIVHITQQMTASKRAQVSKILAAMDSGASVENSNGDSGN
ncbi:LOW QUALITY PROTEIN: acetyl-CoA carboxylase-like [Acropora millepora]|uniref:LOW QUALITY PROTEIN: acetyl-CoA carboxylase-like n=1 Tax=Acropora millepora TaxID=45264 RepID=UPI001CF3184B|nr:LOW QUALITY PROTEIN: acetyl-CoA carboxylase-like [Acropora millepora]